MLAIFKKGSVETPQELNSPAYSFPVGSRYPEPKFPEEIVREFKGSQSSNTALSLGFGDSALLAYFPSQGCQIQKRIFSAVDNIYCIFMGNLNNLGALIKQYGLSKNSNEAMLVIRAYQTLRDRGPYPADQVLRDLEGSFAFVLFDNNAGTVFTALDNNDGGGRVSLFWGVAADGSTVLTDNLTVIKSSCAKSFAPFPPGCMFHSEVGLRSFQHPKNKLKAMPRIDSEGAICGANFKVDISSKISSMPRVGSEANWALSTGGS